MNNDFEEEKKKTTPAKRSLRRRHISSTLIKYPKKTKTVNKKHSSKNSFPVKYSFYRTFEFGSNILVINVKEANRNYSLNFLIDSIKLGLKDFSIKTISAKRFIKDISNSYEFLEISFEEATIFLAQGLAIAEIIGTPISENCFKWLKKFSVDKINLSGSLYKCSECEIGELSEDIIKEIIKIARDELKSGIAGTPGELMTEFLCNECELNFADYKY